MYEVYIECVDTQTISGSSTSGKFRVDLSPVNMVEDTYTKSPEITSEETYPEDGEDPSAIVVDSKKSLHRFIITGTLTLNDGDATQSVTKLDPNQASADGLQDPTSKIGRLRILYGYGGTDSTQIKFQKGEVYYVGVLSRITLTQSGGEGFYEYILEVIEGSSYD